jgi:hypothetical protein
VPPAERVAVFDNDGTLWAEQPIYFQFAFAMERIGQMVAKDPALREKPAFAAIADRDQAAMAKLSEKDLMEAVFAVQVGLTTSRVSGGRQGLARPGAPSPFPHALHRFDLQAAAGVAGLSARRRGSRPTSSPAVRCSSCGCSPSKPTACRPNR